MMKLKIITFGGFDIFFESKALSDVSARRSKTWAALKYLIAHHKRPVPSDELISVLWPDDSCLDPGNSLKNIIYRLRKLLNEFDSGQYIGFSQGSYTWNADSSMDSIDFERALALAQNAILDEESRIAKYKEAIGIYKGEYMHGESDDLGLINFSNYYRRLFLNAISELAYIYEARGDYEDVLLLLSEAVKVEPFEEALYAKQIRLFITTGEYGMAKQQYKVIEKLLKKEFGTEPSGELKGLWTELTLVKEGSRTGLNDIKNNLDHSVDQRGAILCGPETFKRIYGYDKHLDERIGLRVFLGMVTLKADNPDDNAIIRKAMTVLRRIILGTLRKSDIVCQYSENQFVLMMTATDEKNKMVPLYRIHRLFEKEGLAGITTEVEAIAVGDSQAGQVMRGY